MCTLLRVDVLMVLFCWLVVVNLGELTDCPVFDGIFNFCQIYSGGTLGTSLLSHTHTVAFQSALWLVNEYCAYFEQRCYIRIL